MVNLKIELGGASYINHRVSYNNQDIFTLLRLLMDASLVGVRWHAKEAVEDYKE